MSGVATFEVRFADDSVDRVDVEYAGRYGTFVLESALVRAADSGKAVTSIMLARTVAAERASA